MSIVQRLGNPPHSQSSSTLCIAVVFILEHSNHQAVAGDRVAVVLLQSTTTKSNKSPRRSRDKRIETPHSTILVISRYVCSRIFAALARFGVTFWNWSRHGRRSRLSFQLVVSWSIGDDLHWGSVPVCQSCGNDLLVNPSKNAYAADGGFGARGIGVLYNSIWRIARRRDSVGKGFRRYRWVWKWRGTSWSQRTLQCWNFLWGVSKWVMFLGSIVYAIILCSGWRCLCWVMKFGIASQGCHVTVHVTTDIWKHVICWASSYWWRNFILLYTYSISDQNR